MTRPCPDLDLDLDLYLEWDLEVDLELNKSQLSLGCPVEKEFLELILN